MKHNARHRGTHGIADVLTRCPNYFGDARTPTGVHCCGDSRRRSQAFARTPLQSVGHDDATSSRVVVRLSAAVVPASWELESPYLRAFTGVCCGTGGGVRPPACRIPHSTIARMIGRRSSPFGGQRGTRTRGGCWL